MSADQKRSFRAELQREVKTDHARLDAGCRRYGVTVPMFRTAKYLFHTAVLLFVVYLIEYAGMTTPVATGVGILLIAGPEGVEAWLMRQGFIADGDGDASDSRGQLALIDAIPNIGEFLDDHEEQHAIFTGAGLGVAAVATGDLQMLAIVGTVVQQFWERKSRPKPADGQNLANDIKREPHYFVAGVFVGTLVGIGVRLVTGSGLPSL